MDPLVSLPAISTIEGNVITVDGLSNAMFNEDTLRSRLPESLCWMPRLNRPSLLPLPEDSEEGISVGVAIMLVLGVCDANGGEDRVMGERLIVVGGADAELGVESFNFLRRFLGLSECVCERVY